MLKNFNLFKKSFSSGIKWTPKIPKHKILLDTGSYKNLHPIWDLKSAEEIEEEHVQPKDWSDNLAYDLMRINKWGFDLYGGDTTYSKKEWVYLRRCLFIETFSGVFGMVGGMMRHLASIRWLRPDGGWIHHLLEEADNGRCHLQVFFKIRQPSYTTRLFILWCQWVFLFNYTLMYLFSSKMAHRFVGYLNEEAIKNYTKIIKEIDSGDLPYFQKQPVSKAAIKYWALPKDATFRDVLLCIRADKVFHREFNHHFADIPKDTPVEGHTFVSKLDQGK
jgi:hypothetical protein